MNIIRMTGGLGNQMFQYALYLKLKTQGKEVKFDDKAEYEKENARPILLWAFGIEYPVASKEEIIAITDGDMRVFHRIRRKISGRKSMNIMRTIVILMSRSYQEILLILQDIFRVKNILQGLRIK